MKEEEEGAGPAAVISPLERQLILIVQEGIPLAPEPWKEIAAQLGTSQEEVLATLRSLLDRRIIKRLAAVPNHYALGVRFNGMAVWDVPDERVSEVGARLGQRTEITHCYRRPRRPGWPYNLFAMVHGMSRQEVLRKVQEISREAGLEGLPHDILFSTRILKKQGTRIRSAPAPP
jgi:DNA-binding Lrp family transcriptional regulator